MRGIAVVDVGYTNAKVILFSSELEILGERKVASAHRVGPHYREIDIEPILSFVAEALPALDAVLPIDRIVISAHGSCLATINEREELVFPLMDYTSEPPESVVSAYKAVMPSYSETYSPYLPGALLHAMQLFWLQRIDPAHFQTIKHIMPSMQYLAMRLGGRAVTEISSMSPHSHLQNLNTHQPSSIALREGWAEKFAPRAKAWDVIGVLDKKFRGAGFRGKGEIVAGVHDSNANLLRYFSAGLDHFTLLSTGTWIISFNTDAELDKVDGERDVIGNVSVFGKTIACGRFMGGKEFEVLSGGETREGTFDDLSALIKRNVMALPSFTDSGGPVPGTGNKGHVSGVATGSERHALASLYCALMVDLSLSAVQSRHDIIVDGPFSQNPIFLGVLAALRSDQQVMASRLRDGTAAGAACLGLMQDSVPPKIAIDMQRASPVKISGFEDYVSRWRRAAL